MRFSRLGLLCVCVTSSGCMPLGALRGSPTSGAESGDLEGVAPGNCPAWRYAKSGDARRRVPLGVSELAELAATKRKAAIESHNAERAVRVGDRAAPPLPWPSALSTARACYEHALELEPGHAESSLGLGVVFLVAANRERNWVEVKRSYAAQAKKHLGRAFVATGGSYEVLYFLANLAIVEGDLPRAALLLASLQQTGERPEAVSIGFGYIAEQRGTRELAKQWYTRALQAGADPESAGFLTQQLRKRDDE